jgi:hypothetical protein
MKPILFCVIGTILMMLACRKEKKPPTATHTYRQTQCADPWGYGSNDSQTLRLFNRFMDSVGVRITAASLDSVSRPQPCLSCMCLSGKQFNLSAHQSARTDSILQRYQFVRVP